MILGVSAFVGLFGAWFFQKIKVPQVVGYIAVGLLLGQSGIGLVDRQHIEALEPFTFFALGMIGFLVGGEGLSLTHEAVAVATELGGAVAVAACAAYILRAVLLRIHDKDKALAMSISTLFLVIGISVTLKLDVILAAMTLGFGLSNLLPKRSVGKFFGTKIGARMSRADERVEKFAGFGLFAQGGVAIGLAIVAGRNLQHIALTANFNLGDCVIAVVTATTIGGIIEAFSNDGCNLLPVTDKNGLFCGVISFASLREALPDRDLWRWLLASDIIDKSPETIGSDATALEAMTIMGDTNQDALVVMDRNATEKVVGIIESGHANKVIKQRLLEQLA